METQYLQFTLRDLNVGTELFKSRWTNWVNSVAAIMPFKQANKLDFPGSNLPKEDTVLGDSAPAPLTGTQGSSTPLQA